LLKQLISSIPGDHSRADLIISRIKENKETAEANWLIAKASALKK
jgi:hypothetical protein